MEHSWFRIIWSNSWKDRLFEQSTLLEEYIQSLSFPTCLVAMMIHLSPKHRIYSLNILTIIERSEFLLSLISWRDGLGIPSSSSPISSPLSIAFWCLYPSDKRDREEQEKAKEESYHSLQNRIEIHQFDCRLAISIHSFPGNDYSYNYLRNEAIKCTSTSHYYMSDMDMIPVSIFFFFVPPMS